MKTPSSGQCPRFCPCYGIVKLLGASQDDPSLKRHNPKSWLEQLDLVTVADGLATLRAEKVFVAEWIGRHLDQALQAAFIKVTGGSVGKIRLTS
jgi:hypothetical protein